MISYCIFFTLTRGDRFFVFRRRHHLTSYRNKVMTRTLQSATRVTSNPASLQYGNNGNISTGDYTTHIAQDPVTEIKLIPLGKPNLPGLDNEETRILRRKQQRLRISSQNIARLVSKYGAHITNGLKATFIFAQHEAGTAVCINPTGWVITCAHCFGESEDEWQVHRIKWLLTYSGIAVQVECHVWDARRDLALGRIVCVEGVTVPNALAFVSLPPLEHSVSYMRTPIVCIGQPGADDLESAQPRKTDYDLVEISEGTLRGVIPGADPQDNSELGTLKHDAWTYWGHSGAPLLCRETGALLGLHSSWDENTAMRHGVPLVAIRDFLTAHLPGLDANVSTGASGKQAEVIMI
ncbi:trypsin-like cysteine/serine peptidase domain-containing protein, partial [Aspergillus granulosus]